LFISIIVNALIYNHFQGLVIKLVKNSAQWSAVSISFKETYPAAPKKPEVKEQKTPKPEKLKASKEPKSEKSKQKQKRKSEESKATTITVQTVTKQDVTATIPPNPPAPTGVYAVTDADGKQYYTSFEEKDWRCPTCGKLDDGSPMIGCDGDCGDWYHNICVGINGPVPEGDWYCPKCTRKNKSKKKKRK